MGQRIRAALVDLGLSLAWFAVVAVVATTLYMTGAAGAPALQLNVMLGAAVVVPVIAFLGVTEGGRYGASPGKQWLGLRVQRSSGGALGRGRAIVRNLVKVGLPWVLGHAAVVALMTASAPVGVDVWILVGIAALLPVTYLVTALLDDGRTPYDIIAGSQVVPAAAGRRVAAD